VKRAHTDVEFGDKLETIEGDAFGRKAFSLSLYNGIELVPV
jgi:hypothetical protein